MGPFEQTYPGALLVGLLLVLTAIPVSSAVAAGDETFCGVGSAPRPVQPSDSIRIASETVRFVEIDEETSPYWQLRSSYELEHTGEEKVRTNVGYLDKLVEDGACDSCTCTEDAAEVEIDGESRDLERIEGGENDGWPRGEVVYQTTIEFEPGQSRTLVREHPHAEPESAFMLGNSVRYDVSPGARWQGTVRRTHLEFELLEPPWDIRFKAPSYAEGAEDAPSVDERPLTLTEYRESLEGDRAGSTTVTFGARKWKPRSNIAIWFRSDHALALKESAGVECPTKNKSESFHRARDEGKSKRAREMVAKTAKAFASETLRRCRHVIYARHGHEFESDELEELFYRPDQLLWPSIVNAAFQKNPNFSEQLFAPWESRYVVFVERVEEYSRNIDGNSN